MNKGSGIGVGSASIVLVFAVLCLTVFSLITFVVAGNNKVLADNEAKLVTGFYEAEAKAERILAEIIETKTLSGSILGVDISSMWAMEMDADIVSFACPVSDSKSLYVDVAIYTDSFDVLCWRMRDNGEWETDDSLNLWFGSENESGVWIGPEFGLDMHIEP